MLNIDNIQSLIDSGEGYNVEFKVRVPSKVRELTEEICAFANADGGYLLIGVDDNGNPVGMPNIDSMQLKIADRIKNNILPSTLGLFDIVTEEIDKVSVVKILISSGLEKPYYIKKQVMSPNGCLTRVGTSSQPMSTARSDEFYRKQIHNTRIGTE